MSLARADKIISTFLNKTLCRARMRGRQALTRMDSLRAITISCPKNQTTNHHKFLRSAQITFANYINNKTLIELRINHGKMCDGFSRLYEYATKELGYSEDQAYRRINAMRVIQEMPVIEEKVSDGRISLSALAAATSAIRAQTKQAKLSVERKLELVEAVEGLSRREAESTLQKLTGIDVAAKESVHPKGDALELKLTITPELLEKIDQLKGWLAHSHPGISTAALIEKLCDDAIAAHQTKLARENRTAQLRNWPCPIFRATLSGCVV